MTDEKAEARVGRVATFLWMAAGVFLLWALSWGLLAEFVPRAERGAFGDMFGAVNSLFSGLAFAGVIWTILLQREELRLQRREMTTTRKEFAGQKEALEAQVISMQRATYDSAFFARLNLLQEIATNIQAMYHPIGIVAGGRAFYLVADGIDVRSTSDAGLSTTDQAKEQYRAALRRFQIDPEPYVRVVEELLAFAEIPGPTVGATLVELIRAQFSKAQLEVLVMEALCDESSVLAIKGHRAGMFDGLQESQSLFVRHAYSVIRTLHPREN